MLKQFLEVLHFHAFCLLKNSVWSLHALLPWNSMFVIMMIAMLMIMGHCHVGGGRLYPLDDLGLITSYWRVRLPWTPWISINNIPSPNGPIEGGPWHHLRMRQVESAPRGLRRRKSGGQDLRASRDDADVPEDRNVKLQLHEINMLKFMFGSSRDFHALHSCSCMCIYINIVYQRKFRWSFQVLKHPGPKQGGVEEICIHTGTANSCRVFFCFGRRKVQKLQGNGFKPGSRNGVCFAVLG